MKTYLFVMMMFFCILVCPVLAQENTATIVNSSHINMNEVLNILVVFLVLSIVFEVALTPIFTWRVFLSYCHKRGFKTPITVSLAFLVFWGYDLDIITDLLNVLKPTMSITNPSPGGQFLTALLIAGGSSGIFQIFTKLGIRNPDETEKKAIEARAMRLTREFKKDEPMSATELPPPNEARY
ncbi:hypothetical protein U27_05601 [Candidatus Vecturithrix granuli]|uniref:Uncharacterized protein n=1 Tax=Vecturithrix granuli TaxID=1499967 RepID=A0A081C222_VECG1|nr:hypothetical protein U27_05601 [Candidatus Vecturithrix granuli]